MITQDKVVIKHAYTSALEMDLQSFTSQSINGALVPSNGYFAVYLLDIPVAWKQWQSIKTQHCH